MYRICWTDEFEAEPAISSECIDRIRENIMAFPYQLKRLLHSHERFQNLGRYRLIMGPTEALNKKRLTAQVV